MKVSGDLLVRDQICVQASGLYLVTSTLEEMGLLNGSTGDHSGVEVADTS